MDHCLTWAFMAMHKIRVQAKRWIRHSPIFDMESFFWVLVFVPIYQTCNGGSPTQDDSRNLHRMCPSTMHESDADLKAALVYDILQGGLEDSCLKGYEDLLLPLAGLVNKYYREARKLAAKGVVFDPATEDKVVDKYITVVQTYLRSKGIPYVDIRGLSYLVD